MSSRLTGKDGTMYQITITLSHIDEDGNPREVLQVQSTQQPMMDYPRTDLIKMLTEAQHKMVKEYNQL